MEKTTYVPLMSKGAQQKINEGSWEVVGLTVKDKKTGRIVANLKTVTNESESGYTPAMFLALNDQVICSQRIVSEQIRQVYQKLHKGQLRIEDKLDFMIDSNFGALQGEIYYHFTRFENLRNGDSASADRFVETGGVLASRLSGMVDALVKNYLSQVEITAGTTCIKYSEYMALSDDQKRFMEVTALKFPNFNSTWCHIFIDGLIELFNELNIVSVCYQQEIFMGYRLSLEALKDKLIFLLSNLVCGVSLFEFHNHMFKSHSFSKYCEQVFSRDYDGNWVRENEAERLEKYWDAFTRDNLAVTRFPWAQSARENPKRDPELYQAVTIVLDLIDKISDLLCRGTQFEDGGIEDSEAIKLLAEKVFLAPKIIPAP